ncbi:MAG TPA: hypothetical protein PLA97_21315 [Rubrivivax sp.]|nr:hypothetical protein [Rubrivivax sp.]
MNATRIRQAAFWLILLAFVAWDLHRSARIDLWREPPLLAAGSGVAPSGGHCSAPK